MNPKIDDLTNLIDLHHQELLHLDNVGAPATDKNVVLDLIQTLEDARDALLQEEYICPGCGEQDWRCICG